MAPQSNPTGFDMKQFTDASTSKVWRARDPWARAYFGPALSLNFHMLTKGIRQRSLEVHRTLYKVESIQTSLSGTRHSHCRICRLSCIRVDILEQTKARTCRRTFRRASLSTCAQEHHRRTWLYLMPEPGQRAQHFRTPESLQALETPAYNLCIFEGVAGLCVVHTASNRRLLERTRAAASRTAS